MNISVVYWAVIAIGLLGIEKSFAQDGTKPPTFGHVGTVPPEEAVLAAIDLMRIEIERFQFELPGRGELRFISYLYHNGKERVKNTGQFRFSASSGKNELILIKYRRLSSRISFDVHMGDEVQSLAGIFIGDEARYNTSGHPFTLGDLATGKKTPFYVFASDPDRVTVFGADESEDRIKEYIKENEMVCISYVELR